MIRVQLDLIFDEPDNSAIARAVESVLDTLASQFGSPGILHWSVAPLPELSLSMEPATNQEAPHG